ncbi:MAG: asparaginase [bacterium]
MKPTILVQSIRNNLVEREHAGFIICMDLNKNIIFQKGNPENYKCFLRSCAKPFQALPIILSDTYNHYGLTKSELAACCASHTGSKTHTETVEGILNKTGLTKYALMCGIHEPLDKKTKLNLLKNNLPATELHNNCSGKHAGMLAVCKKQGWDIENYIETNHPLQKWIKEITKNYCNINNEQYYETLDGCGTPVGGMTLEKMTEGFLNLLKTKEGKIIIDAFINNPILIGGEDRIDSLIIKESYSNLMAKVGAEGLCIVLNKKLKQCLLVKIMDSNMQARSIALLETLKQLNWLNKEIFTKTEIKNIHNPELTTLQGYKTGEIKAVF